MNNRQEEENTKKKRNLKNTTPNQENYDSISERNEPNQNIENQNQIQNNMNQHVNIEVPSTLTNDPIVSNTNQAVNPQGIINYNPIMNQQGQFQQIQIPNAAALQNQMLPPNTIIIVNRPFKARMQYIRKYTPTQLQCPYCLITVTTVPTSSWTCNSCNKCCGSCVCYFFSCFIGLLIDLCSLCCYAKDFCCYEADHRCPNCGNIIAQTIIKDACQDFWSCYGNCIFSC